MRLGKQSSRRASSPSRRSGCLLRTILFLFSVLFCTCVLVFTLGDSLWVAFFSTFGNFLHKDFNFSSIAFVRPATVPIKAPKWLLPRIAAVLAQKHGPPPPMWWPEKVKNYTHRAGGEAGLTVQQYKERVKEIGFLLFEPWNGGWNNRRMSFELAIAFAMITNRTLVLPPVMWVNMMRGESGFESFFELSHLRRWLNVLTWVEFEQIFKDSILNTLPPAVANARTVDCGTPGRRQVHSLCERYTAVRKAAISKIETMDFTGNNYLHPCSIPKAFGGCAAPGQRLLHENVAPAMSDETISPTAVAAFVSNSSDAVMRSFHLKRKTNAMNGEWFWPAGTTAQLPSHPHIVHFAQTLFMPWYTVLWQPSRAAYSELAVGIRDHAHLRRDLLEVAWKIIQTIGPQNYSAVHARRQDFKLQYKTEYLEPETVSGNVQALIESNETIYLASDEGDVDFYSRFARKFPDRVVRLSNFQPLLEGTKEWQLPMIEQLICAYGRIFVGTRLSTFSAYITRIRGHLNKKFGYSKVYSNVYFTDQKYPPDIVLPEDIPFAFSGMWKGLYSYMYISIPVDRVYYLWPCIRCIQYGYVCGADTSPLNRGPLSPFFLCTMTTACAGMCVSQHI